jgi:hypothetical protein
LALDENTAKELDKAFWEWIFSRPDNQNHPLRVSDNGQAQERRGKFLILAGSLPGGGQKNRVLTIPQGIDSIFVPADNNLKTMTDDDGPDDPKLTDKANEDNDGAGQDPKVKVDGVDIPVNRLPAHCFDIDIRERIHETGNNKHHGDGEEVAPTRAAAACHYAIIPANTLHSGSKIEIRGRDIRVTYTVSAS